MRRPGGAAGSSHDPLLTKHLQWALAKRQAIKWFRQQLQAVAGRAAPCSARDPLLVMPTFFAFTVGALMYYTLFYRARLVPRWLSGWGIAAVVLMMTACLLALFSNTPVTGYTFLFLPIAVQEMVLAGWLLVKGFSSSTTTSTASRKAQPFPAGTPQPS